MILAIAFIEALCLYALLVAFTLTAKGKAVQAEALHDVDVPVAEAHE